MEAYFLSAFVGLICIVLGIFNRKGRIESLHSYHRKRVSEEDRIPFGKMVGNGMIITGASIIGFSGLSIATALTENALFTVIGAVIMTVGVIVGFILAFGAMMKYNKGIF